MNTQAALLIAEALLKYGPAVARGLVDIFSKRTVTLEDWQRVFALAEKPYEQYVAAKTPSTPAS